MIQINSRASLEGIARGYFQGSANGTTWNHLAFLNNEISGYNANAPVDLMISDPSYTKYTYYRFYATAVTAGSTNPGASGIQFYAYNL